MSRPPVNKIIGLCRPVSPNGDYTPTSVASQKRMRKVMAAYPNSFPYLDMVPHADLNLFRQLAEDCGYTVIVAYRTLRASVPRVS